MVPREAGVGIEWSELSAGSLGKHLKVRFPAPLDLVQSRWALSYVISEAEARTSKLTPLVEPDRVAAGWVNRQIENAWIGVGGFSPGDESEQYQAFESLLSGLARHLAKRARERAVNRREFARDFAQYDVSTGTSASAVRNLGWSNGAPHREGSPEAVIARMDILRELRRLQKILTSDAQRQFLAALERRPELWDSLGHGELGYIAEQVGVSACNARQIMKRIRDAVNGTNIPDAA
jgi:hypothetical protein